MPRYVHAGRDTGILRYASGDGWIDITFKDGWTYRYTDATSGPDCVRAMQALAQEGRGLNTFINQHVRERYASKRRKP